MGKPRRTRKLLIFLGSVVALAIVLLLSLPLWFPWVLRPVAALGGGRFGDYERLGYTRFALSNVSWTNASLTIKAGRVETFLPTALAWHWAKKEDASQPFVIARDWSVDSHPVRKKNKSVWQEASAWVRPVREVPGWVPSARLTNGVVKVPGAVIPILSGVISNETLYAQVDVPKPFGLTSARLSLGKASPYQLLCESIPARARGDLMIRVDTNGIRIDGTGSWASSDVTLSAAFARTGSLPQTAAIKASDLKVPAEVLQLPGYREITGSATAGWSNGQFVLDLTARAEPVPGETNLPAATLVLRAHGDTNEAIIESARLTSPAVTATLSREVALHRHGSLLSEPASLQVTVDLDKQPWLPATGRMQGEAFLYPGEERIPSGRFHLKGTEIATPVVEAQSLDVEGALNWPRLSITRSEAAFEDGSELSVQGLMDLQSKTVDQGVFSFRGPLVNRWLPAGYSVAGLVTTGSISGPVKAPVHSGALTASQLFIPGLKPLQLQASWQGTLSQLQPLTLLADSGSSILHLRADLKKTDAGVAADIQELRLLTNRQPALVLQTPVKLSMSRSSTNGVSIHTSPLRLTGAAGDISLEAGVNWPVSGNFKLTLQNVDATLVEAFLDSPADRIYIHAAAFDGHWDRGPVEAILRAEVSRDFGGNPWSARLDSRTDAVGVTISNLLVASAGRNLAEASGHLPFTVTPGAAKILNVRPEAPLSFQARAQPGALEPELEKRAGLQLTAPKLGIHITGTWRKPEGTAEFSAARAAFVPAKTNLPALEHIRARLVLDRDVAQLEEATLLVDGQRVTAGATLPLGTAFWSDLSKRKMPDWSGVSANLQIENADLSPLNRRFPKLVSAQGELNANIWMQPGFHFAGEMTIDNARTPPIGSLGAFHDVGIHLRFDDRVIRLQTAVARLGGAPVTLRGALDLTGTNWLAGETPPFQVVLHGTSVPLSRQPDSIVRSDLDLTVTKTNGAPPLITGTATLTNSYFLSDLSALLPGGKVAKPESRPPYFSIAEAPLADWRLAVHVTGPQFLRVRSPLFVGVVSANLRLTGTLKDPIALGEARTDSGVVRFPFATLNVQQGQVALNSEDPYRPRLNLTATTRQFGYDIRMEVKGPADNPLLQFNTTPPLSSEQVVLMVTAGELPRGDVNLTAQQRAQGLAFFLARDFLAKLGIGDRGEQRLIIRSGQDVSEQGTPTYDVEYKINRRWSITGEYDRFGDFNAGVKWEAFSK